MGIILFGRDIINKTSIEWVVNPDGTQGYTWNPVTGCLNSCPYCYARKIANRFQGDFKPKFHPERLNEPLKIKKPSTIFVGSMADMFGNWVEHIWIEQILDITRKCQQHRFLFLTKNPNRYESFLIPPNSWVGYTATSTRECCFDFRGKGNFYLSAEPLLGKVYIKDNLRWVIIGALNSNGKPVLPDKGGTRKEWVISLLCEADKYKIPVFIKDSLCELYPDLPRRREIPYL